MEEDANTVTLKHLEQRALSVGQCKNILKKIKEGEERYAQIEGDFNELHNALGLNLEPISRKNKSPKSRQNDSKAESDSLSKKNKNVGLRKPQRDPIGTERDAG